MTVIEFMKSRDPNYGSQEHQRDYLERLDEMERRAPCAVSHDSGDPPCHGPKCYPEAIREAVVRWQIAKQKSARVG